MEEVTIYESKSIVNRTPELIATEINNIKNQTKRMVLYNSIEIGRRLIEAKQLLQHGEWGSWLKEKVDYSQRTANNLMRIFDEYGSTQITMLEDNSNSQALANLSYTQAVALLGIPEEERETFAQENDIDNISTRELQQLIKEREEAEKEKDAALRRMEEIEDETKDIIENLKNQSVEYNAEAERLKKQLEELQTQLYEAEENESIKEIKEALEEKEKELEGSLNKIEELKRELGDKPAEPIVIEKIPEEIENELKTLRKKNQENQSAIKFNVCFDTLVRDFKDLLSVLAGIEEDDPEAAEKYKNAIKILIRKMADRL